MIRKKYYLLQVCGHFIMLTSIPLALFVYAALNIYYALGVYSLYGTFGYYLLGISYKQEDINKRKAVVLRSIRYAFLFVLLIAIALMLYGLISSLK
jgi:hypothetical protein